MQRKISLAKDAVLWEEGDDARNIAVLEKGALGVRRGKKLLGIVSPGMVLGETALLAIKGETHKRTATVFALEDDTSVTEYPAFIVKRAVDKGEDAVALLVLTTLIGQTCRNFLIVMSNQPGCTAVEVPLKSLLEGLLQSVKQTKTVGEWSDFMLAFRFHIDLRDYSARIREQLADLTHRDAILKASEKVKELFEVSDAAAYLEQMLKEETEKDAWLTRKTQPLATQPPTSPFHRQRPFDSLERERRGQEPEERAGARPRSVPPGSV